MPWVSRRQARWGHSPAGLKALGGAKKVAEWDAATPKGSLKKKKKPKFKVNNNIKAFGQMDDRTNVIEINKKKHKGNRKELADTIKHELLHVKHPNMTEKEVYKKTAPTMSKAEEDKMIAKLRMKKLNYKIGAAKRKMKIHGKVAPGELITKMNAQKTARTKEKSASSNFKAGVYGLM